MSASGSASPFDEDIDRRAVPALKVHPRVVGEGASDLFAAGVADMDFRAPPAVLAALERYKECYIIVNNKAEGSSPLTVRALAELLVS